MSKIVWAMTLAKATILFIHVETDMASTPEQNTLTALAASLLAQMQHQAHAPGLSSSSSAATSTIPAASNQQNNR